MARPTGVERLNSSVENNKPVSFTSPYSVHDLDTIPTPVLKLLVVMGPTLQKISQLVDIIMWKTDQPRQSILLILLWIMICLWTWQLLAFGLPSLLLYKLGRDWLLIKTSRQRRETVEKLRQQQRLKQEEKLRQDRYHDEEDDEELKQRLKQQKEEEDELISRKIRPQGEVSLDDTIQDLNSINACIDVIKKGFKKGWMYMDGTNKDTTISILSCLLYVWPVWILINWWFGCHVVFAIVGAILLASPSPWFHIICLALRKNILLKHFLAALWAYGVALITTTFSYKKKLSFKTRLSNLWSRSKTEKSKALKVLEVGENLEENKKGNRSEMVFQFEVYENQRWWLGVNWTTNMMPSEREAWTDTQLKPIVSKEEFKLPEPSSTVTHHPLNETQMIERHTNKVWSWADGDWWVDMTGEIAGKIDHNGWEYGNNAWKQLTGMPGLQTFTRRRKWCRRARLVERQLDEIIPKNDNKKSQ